MHLRRYLWRTLITPVRDDLETDAVLKYILLFGVVVCGFGIWFRLPNFAVPDEYSRLIQPMKVAGRFIADPGFESIRTAITDGRSLGATFYLFAIVLVPVFLVVVLTGQLGQFMSLGSITSRWTLWHETPAWFWSLAIVLGRLVSVLLATLSIYLVYRLGCRLRDRWTGRVGALALSVSLAFVGSAHTINEDIPMVVLLLTTTILATRYLESGDSRTFLLGCGTAAGAAAFKLTGGTAVLVIGASYLLRANRTESWRDALVRPRLLLGGLAIGLVTIAIGFPSVIVGGPGELVTRITATTGQKTTLPGGIVAGIEFWLLRGYLSGLGLPLVAGILLGLGALVLTQARGDNGDDRLLLVAVPVVATLAVFSTWRYVRVHHLLPTIPFLVLLAAIGAASLGTERKQIVRITVGVVLLSSLVFTSAANVGLTNDPRDRATNYLQNNAEPGDSVEVYENSIADVAAIHGQPLSRYSYPEENASYESSLVVDEAAYTEWMVGMPQRQPEYIQLTHREFRYITPGHPDAERFPRRAAYIRGLLDGEYNYTVAATFGSRQASQSTRDQILRAGVEPQFNARATYVVILSREDA